MLISIVSFIGGLVVLLWLSARLFLRGPSLTQFDDPVPPHTGKEGTPSDAHFAAVESMKTGFAHPPKGSPAQSLAYIREKMDELGNDITFDGSITPVDIDGMPAEWVLGPNADPNQRLLYIHGGGWSAGSPLSHRAVTTEYATRLNMAVLAIDYRLIPEHSRFACVEDCQKAYRWIIDNGPNGPSPATNIVISGDSAGGNLTLVLTSWLKSENLKQPTAAVALSPATDATFTSKTLRTNIDTDPMLGPLLGKFVKSTPNWLMLWGNLLRSKTAPTNPLLSPVHDDLKDLPPTLLQASTAEMLVGDSIRYFNKATREGSPVELQLWPHMMHVWQLFVRDLPEAVDAFDHIEAFIRREIS